jgi:hypothetical protein
MLSSTIATMFGDGWVDTSYCKYAFDRIRQIRRIQPCYIESSIESERILPVGDEPFIIPKTAIDF